VDSSLDEVIDVDIAGAAWAYGIVDYLFQACGERDGIIK
jgi:hypothetical protein